MSPRNASGCISPVRDGNAQFAAMYPIVRRVSGARWAGAAWQFSTLSIDRQDLEQETQLAAWSALRYYDPGRASVRTFLQLVAKTRIASLLRTARQQLRFESIQIDQILAPDSISALELRTDIRCVTAFLSQRDREIALVLMHHSVAATTRKLGISRSGTYRAIRRIRAVFVEAGLGLGINISNSQRSIARNGNGRPPGR